LGRAIRRLRRSRNLTIEALALAAGMSPGHLGRVERGHGNPRLDKLFALSDALGVTFTDIVLAAEDEAARHGEHLLAPGERLLTAEEFEQHFGHLPIDGEG
jgi:transcriptional regulator with XRE-family HTH domain